MDFVHDQLALSNKLRILTIVDTHSRLCPATDARFTYRGEDVVQTLEKVCRQIGYPKTIRVDNGEPSSFLATLVSGLMPMRLPWTSRGQVSPRITASFYGEGNAPPGPFLIPPHVQ